VPSRNRRKNRRIHPDATASLTDREPTASQPTLPVEPIRFIEIPADEYPNSPEARPSWSIALLAGLMALPLNAARYAMYGASRLARRARDLRGSLERRGEHLWHDWLGRGDGRRTV
jgi:hypothetical protein